MFNFNKLGKIEALVSGHTNAVQACFERYASVMDEILDNYDQAKRKEYMNEMKHLESKADSVRHQIIHQLLEGGLLVDSRKSLMHVIEGMDNVADMTEDIVIEFYLQELVMLKEAIAPIKQMNQIIRMQLDLLVKSVIGIVTKYDTDEMMRMLRSIESYETDVDNVQQEAIKKIYELDIALAEKMQQRDMLDMVACMADLIEDISDQIEIIMMARKV